MYCDYFFMFKVGSCLFLRKYCLGSSGDLCMLKSYVYYMQLLIVVFSCNYGRIQVIKLFKKIKAEVVFVVLMKGIVDDCTCV